LAVFGGNVALVIDGFFKSGVLCFFPFLEKTRKSKKSGKKCKKCKKLKKK
jgi:hypothetical protein